MLGLVLPALAIGPVATVLLWAHHPLLAVASAPLSASAAVLGLSAWVMARKKAPARRFYGRTRTHAHFGAEWHAAHA
jgi:hypothetical protein